MDNTADTWNSVWFSEKYPMLHPASTEQIRNYCNSLGL